MVSCKFTKDYTKFKPTIDDWFNDECMADDESCYMAGETIELLERVNRELSGESEWFIQAEHDARMDELKNVNLIECDDELVGYMKYKEWYPEDGMDVIYTEELFIHPDSRKKGYGVWAVKEAFKQSGAKRMTGNSLHQAQTFWKGLGAWMSPYEIQGKRVFKIDYY